MIWAKFIAWAVMAMLARGAWAASSSPLATANAALQNGEADKALSVLNSLAPADAHLLHCRVSIMLERWDEAAGECEQAVNLAPENSMAHLWFARALGQRASRASFLNAYSLAKRVRAEFEEAVRLDARNVDALMDLSEFYYSAPGVVGGGIDKALKVFDRLEKLDPARAMELHAQIDIQRKNYDAAEKEFKQAIAAAPHPAYQWVSLAGFYRSRGRFAEMVDAVHSASAAYDRDRKSAPALFDAAGLLIRAQREPELAARLLNNYLASPVKSEQAPAFVAHLRLARLLNQLGDKPGANREQALALALAHDYKPAQEHKH